jgi:hypothetical protein
MSFGLDIIWLLNLKVKLNFCISEIFIIFNANDSGISNLKKASMRGIEPPTFGLGGRCSTIELHELA